ncbi:MAG: InlB B-repeat-containing protein [Defluviitaleaceae bacterium]|nr:InlB B-repeat-containing protein [Defluviitaleaceae bacterium]
MKKFTLFFSVAFVAVVLFSVVSVSAQSNFDFQEWMRNHNTRFPRTNLPLPSGANEAANPSHLGGQRNSGSMPFWNTGNQDIVIEGPVAGRDFYQMVVANAGTGGGSGYGAHGVSFRIRGSNSLNVTVGTRIRIAGYVRGTITANHALGPGIGLRPPGVDNPWDNIHAVRWPVNQRDRPFEIEWTFRAQDLAGTGELTWSVCREPSEATGNPHPPLMVIREFEVFPPGGSGPVTPPGEIYNMQTDSEWVNILNGTTHTIMRGTGVATGAVRVDGPPREINLPTRSGTSQGLRVRAAALLDALANDDTGVSVQYNGRLNSAGTSQIRIESTAPFVSGENIWTQSTSGTQNIFSHEIFISRAQLNNAVTNGNGDITLGAAPQNAALTITNVVITAAKNAPVTWPARPAAPSTIAGTNIFTLAATTAIGNAPAPLVNAGPTPTRDGASILFAERTDGWNGIDIRIAAPNNLREGDEIIVVGRGSSATPANSQITMNIASDPWTQLTQTPVAASSAFTLRRVLTASDIAPAANFRIQTNAAGATMPLMIDHIVITRPNLASFTVTFEPNGGTRTDGGLLSQNVSQNGAAIAPVLARSGFVFGGWNRSFENVTANLTVTANWLRIGAVASGGTGNVTSADVVFLARHVADHAGFALTDRRIGNLRGEDRDLNANDVVRLFRWLVGYDFDFLASQVD